ncbi:MAG: S49 family peptidase, partial [Phycisphaerae bacterium]|nr:S49 family peptidase [Phycisphaerae bacterium]
VKPLVVSIAQVGGSGGYYIACGAPKIIADPAGIVGSIGVIGGKLADGGVLDKLGITTFEMTRGMNAGLEMLRPWNEREMAKIRQLAQCTYDTFVSRVAESRSGKVKNIAAVAEGRVFTALQAVDNGLVDGVGGLRDAIMAARKAANLTSSHIITLPRPKTFADLLYGDSEASLSEKIAGEAAVLGRLIKRSPGLVYLINLAELLDDQTVLTAMPYYFSIRN